MTEDRMFSELELRLYDGDRGPMYVAFQGLVYDVTDCPHWKTGLHQGQHFPGLDLSGELDQAPHGTEVFKHPCARQVGRLAHE
jgi:predicted heme/steroid binding protein